MLDIELKVLDGQFGFSSDAEADQDLPHPSETFLVVLEKLGYVVVVRATPEHVSHHSWISHPQKCLNIAS